MRNELRERLIGGIYDAALDSRLWSQTLLDITEAMNAGQSSLSVTDPLNSLSLVAPFWDESCRRSFIEHYRHQFSLRTWAAHVPPGRTFTYGDLTDIEWFQSTAFYNEWWAPQNSGAGSLGVKLVADGRVNVLLTSHSRRGQDAFETSERENFEALVPHLIRAVAIQRKLQIAGLRSRSGLSRADAELAIVDRGARILDASETVLQRLSALSLLSADRGLGKVVTVDGVLEELVQGAVRHMSGGHVDVRSAGGGTVRITVVPCRESEACDMRSLSVDRPAALLWISVPEELDRTRRELLAKTYGLTPTEALVAVEAAKGDSRAAMAARLGVRETTVRAHLTAIFGKTGVRRRAELVRLVQTC
ncbi:helix-turn-helix transcriptional regulator [Sphingomonas sp.]|jgi:DNA-binding CsgD family transcriptional regulator|uniref:helix-turn-helix transcriptional regulator n=1 Tax=Sphingomonas sp. TaxID=28214 RepID=UPI002DF662B4|nr:helix-turn-helix transcriptional regulator [Sphingomonas sp.]